MGDQQDMAGLFKHFDAKIDLMAKQFEQRLSSKAQEEEKIFSLMTSRLELVTAALTILEKKIAAYEPTYKSLSESMPNGDFAGHAKYHEEVMKALADKSAFWKKMKESVATWGAIGFLGLVLTAVWKLLLQGPHV